MLERQQQFAFMLFRSRVEQSIESLEDWRNFATGDQTVISIDNDQYLSIEIEMPGFPGFGGLPKSRSVQVKNERATFACEDTRVQIEIIR